jgi:hypothetical protein
LPSGENVMSYGQRFQGGAIRIFTVAAPRGLKASHVPTWYPVSVAVSPDGRTLIAGERSCGQVLFCKD